MLFPEDLPESLKQELEEDNATLHKVGYSLASMLIHATCGLIMMLAWNHVLSPTFHIPTITYLQAALLYAAIKMFQIQV